MLLSSDEGILLNNNRISSHGSINTGHNTIWIRNPTRLTREIIALVLKVWEKNTTWILKKLYHNAFTFLLNKWIKKYTKPIRNPQKLLVIYLPVSIKQGHMGKGNCCHKNYFILTVRFHEQQKGCSIRNSLSLLISDYKLWLVEIIIR